jgi:hypothetical protein
MGYVHKPADVNAEDAENLDDKEFEEYEGKDESKRTVPDIEDSVDANGKFLNQMPAYDKILHSEVSLRLGENVTVGKAHEAYMNREQRVVPRSSCDMEEAPGYRSDGWSLPSRQNTRCETVRAAHEAYMNRKQRVASSSSCDMEEAPRYRSDGWSLPSRQNTRCETVRAAHEAYMDRKQRVASRSSCDMEEAPGYRSDGWSLPSRQKTRYETVRSAHEAYMN